MASFKTRILILCKTYPTPSSTYAETVCVAGMNEADGALIRLYPVPFRSISDDKKFRKWQWIEARIEKARKDHRRESHRIFIDTIRCTGTPIPTSEAWKLRRDAIDRIPVFADFSALDRARERSGTTLGLLRPARILGLDITPAKNAEWTKAEKEKLLSLQRQGDLLDPSDSNDIALLRKLPFDIHYRYECDADGATAKYRHKIVDWEIGALYWNVRRDHGSGWEAPFRKKLESTLPASDLMFLMGTIHRFPDQWLIVSLIYPPKLPPIETRQPSLL